MKSLTQKLGILSLAVLMSTMVAAEETCTTNGQIMVVGQGEVKATPDRARLNYRVAAIKNTPEEARVEVEKTVSDFSTKVAALNLGDNAFVADSLSITPNYEWNQKKQKNELKGYEASREVNLNIKDFTLIGKLTDIAMSVGINQIAGFQYYVEDSHKYEVEAMQKAIADAKERAQLLADGFEVQLGQPCQLSYGNQGGITPRYAAPMMMMAKAEMEDSGVGGVYQAEPLVIRSEVSAVFAIGDKKESK